MPKHLSGIYNLAPLLKEMEKEKNKLTPQEKMEIIRAKISKYFGRLNFLHLKKLALYES